MAASSIRRCVVMVVLVLASGAAHSEAHAATSSDAAGDARAAALFDAGERAYREGRFADAISLLRQANDLRPGTILLYDIARAYEGLGQYEPAALAYEAYLAKESDAPDRALIEARVGTLRRTIAEREALQKLAQTPPPARRASPAPWIVAGAGFTAVAAGGVLAWLASSAQSRAEDASSYLAAQEELGSARGLGRASIVCFVAGGAALASGLVWAALEVRASRRVGAAGVWTF